MPDLERKREAPIGLRLPESLRNRVAELATREHRSFHRQLVRLIEIGLDAETSVAAAVGAPPEPEGKDVAGTERSPGKVASQRRDEGRSRQHRSSGSGSASRLTAGAAKGMCVHRVPLDSFCPRCPGD